MQRSFPRERESTFGRKGNVELNIRKAELRDVPALYKLINRYVVEQVLLPRPLSNLYEDVWEFTVAEEDGELLGCGALKFYSQELGEIRSLCVDAALKAKGVGTLLTGAVMDEAERCGLTLIGFLRNGSFNVYSGTGCISGLENANETSDPRRPSASSPDAERNGLPA